MDPYLYFMVFECNLNLLSLKLDYSKYRGWSIKIHKEGSDNPIIFLKDYDDERLCQQAYYQLLEYLDRLQEEA